MNKKMEEEHKQKRYNILIVDNECDKCEITRLISYLEKKYIPSSKKDPAFTKTLVLPDKSESKKKDDFFIFCKSNKYVEDARQSFRYDVESIDLILLDINFGKSGEIAGIKFLKEIRKTDPHLPVCIMTQYRDESYAYQAGRNMASFYMDKKDLFEDKSILDRYILEAKKNEWFLYNRDMMKTVNEELAKTYDDEEYSKPGTIAFCYWEDEIIRGAIEDIKKRFKKERIKILDAACGTGRYEVLFQRHFKDDFEMIGVDFAGGMLEQAREKLESHQVYVEPFNPEKTHIRLQRGMSEKLPFPENEFHIVILGFGVPSYTKFNYSMPEAYRVLEEGGLAIFTVYNKEAAFNKQPQRFNENPDERPLASWVEFFPFNGEEKEKNPQGYHKLIPQGKKEAAFEIQVFTVDEFQGILNRFSFKVDTIKTFPKLYTTTSVSEIKRRILEGEEKFKPEKVKKDEEYKPPTKDPPPFSWLLYQIDSEESDGGSREGFYITAVAEKVITKKDD